MTTQHSSTSRALRKNIFYLLESILLLTAFTFVLQFCMHSQRLTRLGIDWLSESHFLPRIFLGSCVVMFLWVLIFIKSEPTLCRVGLITITLLIGLGLSVSVIAP